MAIDWTQVGSNSLSAIGGAVMTGVAGYLTKRHTSPSKKAQEFETAVKGFHQLVADLQADHKRLSSEILALRTSVTKLSDHIDTLEETLRSNGIPIPPRPALRVA